jgi:hypothetical protein
MIQNDTSEKIIYILCNKPFLIFFFQRSFTDVIQIDLVVIQIRSGLIVMTTQ